MKILKFMLLFVLLLVLLFLISFKLLFILSSILLFSLLPIFLHHYILLHFKYTSYNPALLYRAPKLAEFLSLSYRSLSL